LPALWLGAENREKEDGAVKRENFLYVGMDLHKETHTAVLTNCWNEKLDVIVIENKPSEFNKLAKKVNKKAHDLGLSPIYGLENAYGYGRSLAVWLIEHDFVVKDINPALSCEQRKSAPMVQKNDEHDAHCVATVLINHLHTLPDAKPKDAHWTLSQLVTRRDVLVKDGTRLKNGLHEQVCVAYPSYHSFFCEIDTKTALYFWRKYPSPVHLRDKSADELYGEFRAIAAVTKKEKAEYILECIRNDGETGRDYQESRDFITQSLARGIERQKEELALIDKEIKKMLRHFDYKLTTLPGVKLRAEKIRANGAKERRA
jgi:hypothetical protein